MTYNDLKWPKTTKKDLKQQNDLMTKNDLKWLKMTWESKIDKKK